MVYSSWCWLIWFVCFSWALLIAKSPTTSVKRFDSCRTATISSLLASVRVPPPPAIFSGYKTVHSKPLTFSRIQQQFEVCSNSYSFVKNLNEWSYPWTILTRKKKKCRSKSPGWSKQKRSASLESQYWRQRWIAAGQSLIQTMRGGEMQYLSPTYLHPKTVFCEMILKISKHKKCNTEMHNHGGVQMK